MKIALLTATALVALSSLAIAQDRPSATAAPKANDLGDPTIPEVKPYAPGGRLHYDVPCRVSSEGTCITKPQYPPIRTKP